MTLLKRNQDVCTEKIRFQLSREIWQGNCQWGKGIPGRGNSFTKGLEIWNHKMEERKDEAGRGNSTLCLFVPLTHPPSHLLRNKWGPEIMETYRIAFLASQNTFTLTLSLGVTQYCHDGAKVHIFCPIILMRKEVLKGCDFELRLV